MKADGRLVSLLSLVNDGYLRRHRRNDVNGQLFLRDSNIVRGRLLGQCPLRERRRLELERPVDSIDHR